MTRPISRLAAGLAGVACAISLAGCSSDAPSPKADSSPTPTATFAGPAMPSQAQGESREAAEAFLAHWVATINYATTSGDTEGLKSLGAKDCETCIAFGKTLDGIYGKGGHVTSAGWVLQSAVPIADQPEKEPSFQLALKFAPQKVFMTKGSKPKSFPGGDQPARIFLTRQDDHWLVQRLDI